MAPPSSPATDAVGPSFDAGRRYRVAVVGNPNTGKTTLFNALTGLSQHTGNYPGVTVESALGEFREDQARFLVVDLPGTYSLAARAPDEMVAVSVLLGRGPGAVQPDVIVCVVDATNLDRNLYLATQVMDIGRPLVIALTMTDLADKQGLRLRIQLGAIKKMFRIIDNFPAQTLEIGQAVANHTEVFFGRCLQHIGNMKHRGFANHSHHRGIGGDERADIGIIFWFDLLAARGAKGRNF